MKAENFLNILYSLLIVLLTCLSSSSAADPAPFGLMINQTTPAELKGKFPVTPLGINKNNGLEAFDISPEHINFEGLISAKAAFSADGILKIVQLSLPKTKFEEILNGLSEKYNIVYKNTPFDGTQEAKFEKDNTYILLYAPKNSPEMDFLYINKKLLEDALQTKPDATANAKRANQVSQL